MILTYMPANTGICPHCLRAVRFESVGVLTPAGFTGNVNDLVLSAPPQMGREDEVLKLTGAACPACGRIILSLRSGLAHHKALYFEGTHLLWPMGKAHPVPQEVTGEVRSDYEDAALILNLSPKASAALSRRCLQSVLREKGRATQHDLIDQISAVIPFLPPYIAESVDAIRNIGNFGAHPIKSKSSDQIIDVEPGEAEWNLEVLDMLFDFYYVQPARTKQKRDALDAKLAEAGKPPVKTPTEGEG